MSNQASTTDQVGSTDEASSTDFNRRCNRCGAAVSRSFVRVFGMENSVHGCLDCLPRSRLSNGDAAKRAEGGEEEGDKREAWRSMTT